MRKHTIWSLLSVLFFLSCSSDDGTKTCRITSVNIKTLYYERVGELFVDPNLSSDIRFEYNGNGQIVKMFGGPVSIYYPTGSGFEEGFFIDDDLVNEVSYEGDVITAQDNYIFNLPGNIIEYKIENGKLISRKIKSYNQGVEETVNYEYEYGSNLIVEKKGGNVFRTFYFENGNLVKVEEIQHAYPTGEIMWKNEIIFLDYDTYENLLQGKYFVNGAFFKAFSKNNFRKLQKKRHYYIAGQYVEDYENSWQFSFGAGVDKNGLVDFFERVCD